jgi:hypothetical protein
VKRHASLDELARLAADDLKPRQAARIRHHLATCAECTELNAQLSRVPAVLSAVDFGPMPENLSARIETALAIEARQRLASEPATEAGRRDLPTARSARRRGFDRPGWRLPGLSVAATRALATAGAIALIGGGGYEIASHSGAPTTSSTSYAPGTSSGNAAVPGAASSQAIGAPINYGHGTDARSIQTVTSATDFEPATLAAQAVAALEAARFEGMHTGPPVINQFGNAPTAATSSGGLRATAKQHDLTGPQLAGCVGRFAPGHAVQLVEDARFKGKPATIIITTAPSGRAAEVWVVGTSCSATNSDLLAHLKVAHI